MGRMRGLLTLGVPVAMGQSSTSAPTAPTVEITSAAAATVYEAFDITVTFSEAVTGFTVGDIVTYQGAEYECRQAHTSQAGWDPVAVPALWLLISPA